MHQLIYTLDASTKKMITDHYLITTRTDLLPDDSIKHEIKTKQKNWSNQITKAAIDSLIVELQSDRDTLQENIHSHRKPNPFYNTGIIIIQEEDTTSFAKRLPFVCFPPWCTTAEKTKLQPSLDGMLEYIVPGNFIIKEK
ncbi:MAG: hypothetical protein COB88_10450 [Flavobacteriales bacterium]|nr:MAG: hypothetical protein COB88_10450 [Flavobacteriales bacterium]